MNLSISHEIKESTLIFTFSGRIDTLTAPEFEKEVFPLIETAPSNILFELSNVDYISSSGLRVFIISQKICNEAQKELVLSNMDTNVKEIFDISGISQLFEFSYLAQF